LKGRGENQGEDCITSSLCRTLAAPHDSSGISAKAVHHIVFILTNVWWCLSTNRSKRRYDTFIRISNT